MNGQQVYVVTAVLKLNGETVRTYQWQVGEPQVSSVTLAVMFDSSHFAHGSTVTVEFVFLDSTGTWRQDDMDAPVKNRMISYGHGEATAAPVPVNTFSGLHYATSLKNCDDWTGPQMLEDMDGATAVHYSGHGAPGNFKDDHGLPVYGVGSTTTPAVEGYRALQMGSGNPPFNSTNAPPVWFALLNTCHCGINNDFIRFCIPYMNGYGLWLENQSVMGFAGTVLLGQLKRIAEIVFEESLAVGKPTEAARLALIYAQEIEFASGEYEGLLREVDVRLYGDDFCRLKGVYLPSMAISTGWKRDL